MSICEGNEPHLCQTRAGKATMFLRHMAKEVLPKSILDTTRHIEVIGFRSRPHYMGEDDRFSYQSRNHDFQIDSDDKVLDVGCGAYPFPYATILVDLYTENSRHRHLDLRTDGKPFQVADINQLPYDDKSFDFVYCSHVLQYVGGSHAGMRRNDARWQTGLS